MPTPIEMALLKSRMDRTSGGRGYDEEAFQTWYAEKAKKLGIAPNPDDPEHYYDYRSAFIAGVEPGEDNHWPSKFKLAGHPNRFVDGMDTITGTPENEVDIFSKYGLPRTSARDLIDKLK